MRIDFGRDDDDMFEDEPPVKQPKVKLPKYRPDQPEYWDQEPSRWQHLKLPKRIQRTALICAALLVVGIVIYISIQFTTPYVDCAEEYGYIEKLERHGKIFKTYECQIIPYKAIHDSTRSIENNFTFSTADKELGKKLKHYRESGVPLRIKYVKYSSAMPWRGNTATIATEIDSVPIDSILPFIRPATDNHKADKR